MFLLLTVDPASAQKFEVIYSEEMDSNSPRGGLIRENDGTLYGAMRGGGDFGFGAVFKISPSGVYSVLHNFNLDNGGEPMGGLVKGNDGHFYGTTNRGGPNDAGTVYKITATGVHTVLFSFDGDSSGGLPYGDLALGSDGHLYGTTSFGGVNGFGTVFKITPAGSQTVLFSFNGAQGGEPFAGLVRGSDGQFYGTTIGGGANGEGTIFKISANGTHTLLHSFNGQNGSMPFAPLVQAKNGDFYGTTAGGGESGIGTIFKISATGVYTLLHSCNDADGGESYAGLAEGVDGAFYGTASYGGASNVGVIFRITDGGVYSILHSFDNIQGGYAGSPPLMGYDGLLYGMAGLSDGIGAVVWKIPPPPQISNLRVTQRPGTRLVDIKYDFVAQGRTSAVVDLEISSDDGATWTVPVVSVTGAVGGSVTPGTGKVITWDAGMDWPGQISDQMRFRVVVDAGFSRIPRGPFTMGRTSGDNDSNAPPVTVTVSEFYMAKTETTKAHWDEVRTWAVNNGYTDLPAGSGKAADHPVHSVSWWDVVKWCNARSEKEGLTPVYSVDGAVMRSGTIVPDANWSANGYRLPTEAEWEKAARGVLKVSAFRGERIPLIMIMRTIMQIAVNTPMI